jgi:GNAT superfamily N-acetyltransferase
VTVELLPLTRKTWPSLESLFSANKTVGGCWCAWYLRDNKDVQSGWGDGNKAFLHEKVRADEPLGLLAVEDRPLGWVAVAPRALYPRLDRSPISESDAGPDAWAVTCFFVHRDARRRGLGRTLLDGAVDFARERGAGVVEAFPVDTEGERRTSGDLYHGTLTMFLAAGFALVERRGTRRALVRRELS